MKKILHFILLIITNYCFANIECKLVNLQCSDSSPTKVIGGYTFKLSDACAKYGLKGDACCWNSTSQYYCGDVRDTCTVYRKNPNCKFIQNICQEKDPLTGSCLLAQSTYSCAQSYQKVESQICTNAICVSSQNNNESDLAHNCFMPSDIASQRSHSTASNIQDLGTIISFLEIGKQGSSDLNSCQGRDPLNCVIFKGDYYTCDVYNPDHPWNNGSDCMIHNQYFSKNMAGQNISDKGVYGSLSANRADDNGYYINGNNYKVGDRYSYGLSNQDQQTMNTINREVQALQSNGNKVYNPDIGANANPYGRNKYTSLFNSRINSVNINNYASDHIGSWSDHLSTKSAKLAWNRIKADPDPFNARKTSLAELGVTRPAPSHIAGWGDDKPVYSQGLCLYLSNYNDGGNQNDTDTIAGRVVCLGSSNCGAVCTNRDPVTGTCITARALPTREEWCCFNSKLAMDLNLAAYDQNITTFYRADSKFINGGNISNVNGKCGGLSISQLAKIDFSKGNYFKDFENSFNISNIDNLVNTNSVTGQAQNSIKNRVNNSMQSKIRNLNYK